MIGPSAIIGIGLTLSLVGSALLAADALAPREFLEKLDQSDIPGQARLANTGFVSEINTVFVFLFVAMGGVIGLAIWYPLGTALIIGPLVFPLWKLLIRIAEYVERLLDGLAPRRAKGLTRTRPGGLIYCIWLILWWALRIPVFVASVLIEYGIDLPFRALSEYVVRPIVLESLRKLAEIQDREAHWGFRVLAFRGLLLLVVGFLYQLIGVVWSAVA